MRDRWHCPFFKYCWNFGMGRLPTINNCPECGPQKHDPKGVSVFQHLGRMPPLDKQAKSSRGENFEEGEDKYHRPYWCPDRLSHSQKRRVQWLHALEKAESQYLEILRKALLDLAVKVNCTQKKGVTPSEERIAPQANKSRWDGIERNKHGVHSPSRILCTKPQGVASGSA
jgi:hypothetical protein